MFMAVGGKAEGALAPMRLSLFPSNHTFISTLHVLVKSVRVSAMASVLVKRFRQREISAALAATSKIAQQPAKSSWAKGMPPSQPPQAQASVQTAVKPQGSKFPVKVHNPFLPTKNRETGRWAPAKYSRRRQAELIKQAKATNALHLIPPGPKLGAAALQAAVAAVPRALRPRPTYKERRSALWARPVMWTGQLKERKVKGADIGNRLYAGKKRMFKGHKWQRTMATREARRKMLLRDMRKRVRRFKSVSWGVCTENGGGVLTGFVGVPSQEAEPAYQGKVILKGGQAPILVSQIILDFYHCHLHIFCSPVSPIQTGSEFLEELCS
jgi:large subunit ribosomal protein L25